MSAVEELLTKLMRTPRLLIVTESASEAENLLFLLKLFECSVTVTGIKDAAHIATNGPRYDLVLVDNRISSDSEALFLRNFCAECPSTPVVLIIGYERDELPVDAACNGFVGLFKRPTKSEEFEALFRSLKLRVRQKTTVAVEFMPLVEAVPSRA